MLTYDQLKREIRNVNSRFNVEYRRNHVFIKYDGLDLATINLLKGDINVNSHRYRELYNKDKKQIDVLLDRVENTPLEVRGRNENYFEGIVRII